MTNEADLAERIYEFKEKLRAKSDEERTEKVKQAEIIRIRQKEEKEYEKEKFKLYKEIHKFIKHFSKTDIFKDFFQIKSKIDGNDFEEEEEIYREDIPGYIHASQSEGQSIVWSRVALVQDGSLRYSGLESIGLNTKICYAAKINRGSLKEIRYELINNLHEFISSGRIYRGLEDSLKCLFSLKDLLEGHVSDKIQTYTFASRSKQIKSIKDIL